MLQTNPISTWAQRCEQIRQQFPINSNKKKPKSESEHKLTKRAWPIAHIDASLDGILNAMNTGMLVLRIDGTIEKTNLAMEQLIGFSSDALVGSNLLNHLAPSCLMEYQGLFEQCSTQPAECFKHGPKEALLIHMDSHLVPVDLCISTLCKEGDEQLIICVVHDLSFHKTEYADLKELAQTDCLTGLANRHTFSSQLQSQWESCRNNAQPLTLIFIDVDYFKKFNDKYGHLKGDKCLQKIACAISQCLPTRDCIAARYGGEEFAVIMPNNALKIAQLTAIRINRVISELRFDDMGLSNDVQVTVSIGMTQSCSEGVACPQTLLQAADDALYLAKAAGRNTIITKDKDIALL